MSVWFCIPAKRSEADSTLHLWRERGYRIALFTDGPSELECDLLTIGTRGYPGYAAATNEVIRRVMWYDKHADWFVAGGDDVEPDLNHTAQEIMFECRDHFGGTYSINESRTRNPLHSGRETWGVMQPTGDRWGENPSHPDPKMRSAYIDRICGSPWIGREFARRVYGGNGPMWPEFTHMFVDEHLQAVAQKLGVFWQCRELIHLHRHWGRKLGATEADVPEFLRGVNTPDHWAESRAIFERLRDGGFAEADNLLPVQDGLPNGS